MSEHHTSTIDAFIRWCITIGLSRSTLPDNYYKYIILEHVARHKLPGMVQHAEYEMGSMSPPWDPFLRQENDSGDLVAAFFHVYGGIILELCEQRPDTTDAGHIGLHVADPKDLESLYQSANRISDQVEVIENSFVERGDGTMYFMCRFNDVLFQLIHRPNGPLQPPKGTE